VAIALKMRNQSEMILARYLGQDNRRELNGEKQLIDLIAPASHSFIDVGANVGDWTELFLRAGDGKQRGILIEPSRSAYAKLEGLFCGNAMIQLIHAAASDEEGEAVFHEEAEAGETSSLLPSWSFSATEAVRVQVTTVDQEVARAGWNGVDVLKIDAEGYDLHVIRGARHLLSEKAIGILQFEYNDPWANAGSTLAAAIALLEGCGYKVFLLRTTGLHPLNYKRWGEFYRCTNFVAVSPQKLSVVSSLLNSEI